MIIENLINLLIGVGMVVIFAVVWLIVQFLGRFVYQKYIVKNPPLLEKSVYFIYFTGCILMFFILCWMFGTVVHIVMFKK